MTILGYVPCLLKPSFSSSHSILQRRTVYPYDGNGGFGRLRFVEPKNKFVMCFSTNGGEVRKRWRVAGKDAVFNNGQVVEEEDEEEVEEEEDALDEVGGDPSIADGTIGTTIRKSKRVLAMHKDLHKQLAERRNAISSMKDVANEEQDSLSINSRDDFLSNVDLSSIREVSQSDSDRSMSFEIQLSSAKGLHNLLEDGFDDSHKKSEYLMSSLPADLAAECSDIDTFLLQQETDKEISVHMMDGPTGVPIHSDFSQSYDIKNGEVHVSSSVDYVIPDEVQVDPPPARVEAMNIIFVSAECAPWSKTGGLGDVAGALPKALAKRGHRVMVVAPRYAEYPEAQRLGEYRRYNISGQDMEVAYFHAFIDGVDFVFIDSPIFRYLGNDIYGGNRVDILKRMILFCKAAVEACWYVPCGGFCYGDGNLAFIANDWHSALLPVYLKAYYRDNGFMTYARSVLVIHNIAHQGRGPLDDFFHVGLPDHYRDLFKLYDPFGGDHFNTFAAGLRTADRVVTVSNGYAWELKTPEGGCGLHGIINESDWKFNCIVNGIDIEDWNPKLDIHLKSDGYINYSLGTLHDGKPRCKAALQRELGLPCLDVPVLAFIGRLDDQKGADLIAEAMPWIAGQDAQLVLLGCGRPDLEDMLRRVESQHYNKVRGWVGFSIRMAHRITAGADVLLMPSRFEPCGLNQLYAMMYGTVPVVRAVGGLRDTVPQYNPYDDTGLGWTFEKYEANRLIDALGHCLNTYRNHRGSWEGLQRRGMMQDLSWENAGKQYEEVLLQAKYQW